MATVFEERTLNTIKDLYSVSKPYADVLGFDPFLAIGGPAEELHTINSYDPVRYYGDQFLDAWSNIWSHGYIEDDLADARLVDQRGGVPIPLKFYYPTLADMGIANVKLATAIELLKDYNTKYPNKDPLNLKKYNDNFDDLVSDLTSRSDLDATAKFAVLEAAEAIEFFEKRAPTTWANADTFKKLGLVTTYYNRGREKMNQVATDAERRTGYRPVPGFGGEKAAENGWALASAVGRDLPFSPTSLGAARAADRASMPGYSGDRGPLRDNQNTAAYGDWGDGRDSSDTGGRGPSTSSGQAPSPFDNSSVGSGRGNGRSGSSRRGNYRGGGADPNAGDRGLNPIQNRREYERRSQAAPSRVPGGLPGPTSTRFADSAGGLAPDTGFGIPAGVDFSDLGSRMAGRGRASPKRDRLARLPDLPAGVMSRMADSRAPVGGLMADIFVEPRPSAAAFEYGWDPSIRIGLTPNMPAGFDQRYGLPDPGTAAPRSNPNHRAGAAAASAAATRVGGLLGKSVNRLGLYAHQHLQEMQRTALAGEEKTIAARTHGRVPSPRRQQGPVALGAFPPAPPQPTELGALRARSPAALRNASVGGLLGPYFAGLGRGLLGPSASSGQPGSSPYGVGFGLAGVSAAIGAQRGATAFSRSNPGMSYTSLGPSLDGLRRSEKFGWTEVARPDGAVRGISYDNPKAGVLLGSLSRTVGGLLGGQFASTGSAKNDKGKKSDKSRYRGARLY